MNNKYDRDIRLKENGKIDIYSVSRAFGPIDPAIDHAIKKLLAGGKRGHKDTKKDYKEAIQSIENCLEDMEIAERNEMDMQARHEPISHVENHEFDAVTGSWEPIK